MQSSKKQAIRLCVQAGPVVGFMDMDVCDKKDWRTWRGSSPEHSACVVRYSVQLICSDMFIL